VKVVAQQQIADHQPPASERGTQMPTTSPAQHPARPTYAPAYYLGRPAALWITAMSPRRIRVPGGYHDLTRRLALRTIPIPRPRRPLLRETIGGMPRQRSQGASRRER